MTSNRITMSRAMSSAGNYHRWVFDSFRGYLSPGGLTLEIGSGHGKFTKLLADVSTKVIATDIDQDAIDKIKKELAGINNVEVVNMDGVEPNKVHGVADNVVAINILEHIKDSAGFISKCSKVLKSGGRLVIFVPAIQLLYSNMDKQAGHFKRYAKAELEQILAESDFKLIRSRYFNFVGFWGWLLNKLFSSGVDSESTNLQVIVFDRLIWLFKFFEVFSCFCGQSLLVVGEKR